MSAPDRVRFKFTSDLPLKYGANAAAEFDNPEWPRFVRITDVTANGDLREDTFRSLPPEVARSYELEEGDILLARSGATVGKSFIYGPSWGMACFAGYLIRSRTSSAYCPKFLYWYLQSAEYWAAIQSNLIQATIQNFSAEKYANIRVPSPCLEVQERIATFLDDKTAQIDALIEKKRALLDRLAEKRQALITQAVTKGLNPAAPMKDSGIDWLGQIPAHWEVKRLKFVGRTRYGLGEPPERDDEGIPFIRATDIYRGKVDMSAVQRVARDAVPWRRNPQLRVGEILVVRSGAYTGDSALVLPELSGFIAGYDMVYTPEKIMPAFVAFTLLAKFMVGGQILIAKQRAAQPHLNAEELGDFVCALPPLGEQGEIADCLQRQREELEAVGKQVSCSVNRLAEYRSALITAAVNG